MPGMLVRWRPALASDGWNRTMLMLLRRRTYATTVESRRYTPWTESEVQFAQRLKLQQRPIKFIAEAMGRSPASVSQQLHHMRKPGPEVRERKPKPPSGKKRGRPTGAVHAGGRKMLETTRTRTKTASLENAIARATARPPKRWTASDLRHLRELKEQKYSNLAVAEEMQRSYQSVSARWHLLKYDKARAERTRHSEPYLTLEDKETIWALKDSGWTWSRIYRERFPTRSPVIIYGLFYNPRQKLERKVTKPRWTEEDIKLLIDLRMAGKPWREVARQVKRTENSAIQRLSKIKSPDRPRPGLRRWTPTEDEVLRQARAAQTRWTDIMRDLPGRSIMCARYRATILAAKDEDVDSSRRKSKRISRSGS